MEGGKKGGEVLCIGTPEQVAKHKTSYTAKFLKKELIQQAFEFRKKLSEKIYKTGNIDE